MLFTDGGDAAMTWRYSILKKVGRERDMCINLVSDQFYLCICNYISDGEFIQPQKNPQPVVADEFDE